MARPESYSDALYRVVKALNESGISYALTGAAALGYYGIPRTSMDIDLVVTRDLSDAQIEALATTLSRNGFAATKDDMRRAVINGEEKLQAFDDKTGFLKVDIFLEKSFGRVADRIDGLKVWFRTFEELVAKKIQYGHIDDVKLLFQRRGRDFQKDRIVRLLNTQQRAKLEQLLERQN
jgi:predicted nucleotidyltransferase